MISSLRGGLMPCLCSEQTTLYCMTDFSKGEQELGWLQQFSGWLSKNCDENPCIRIVFNSKSPSKVRACADSRRNFWTTNQKTTISFP